ncbi:hypothetical protein PV350_46440, partial [Streptomyces sp. PA03-6a]|nr:hypothetical protein [Streptomyces sp. PA03-6a]
RHLAQPPRSLVRSARVADQLAVTRSVAPLKRLSKSMVGVTGVVRDTEARVLVLRHCPRRSPVGLPAGCARQTRIFRNAVARGVSEEASREVEVGEAVHPRRATGRAWSWRMSVMLVGGFLKIDSFQVPEAK